MRATTLVAVVLGVLALGCASDDGGADAGDRESAGRTEGTPQARDDRDPDNSLYVHLAFDGGIFVIRGNTGEELWLDRAGLRRELDRIKGKPGASIVYSRERGQEDPPRGVTQTFRMLADYEFPIQLLEKPHPSALVPPDERRDLKRTD